MDLSDIYFDDTVLDKHDRKLKVIGIDPPPSYMGPIFQEAGILCEYEDTGDDSFQKNDGTWIATDWFAPSQLRKTQTIESKPLTNALIIGFGDALYHGACSVCGDKLEWEAAFDADGTNYYERCCGLRYRMSPHTVTISVEKE